MIHNNDPIQISCEACNWKPYDTWDPSPEGFTKVDSYWLCDECNKTEDDIDPADGLEANLDKIVRTK